MDSQHAPAERHTKLDEALSCGGTEHTDSEGFEEVDHTADVALRIWGPDFEALLRQAALGTARLTCDSMPRGVTVRKRFTLEAFDRESLLVEWLNELAFSMEADRSVFFEFDFECVTDRRLIAVAHGRQVDSLQTPIKAVTYHNLKIVKTDRRLEVTVVFDV